MERIRAAVIGAGYISEGFHCPALKRLTHKYPALELAAVCDASAERARSAAGRFGFKAWYGSLDEMLKKEQIDAAWVLTPPSVIPEVALKFIDREIPLLLEKPPGDGSADVERLIEAVERKGLPHVVALNRRFIPLVLRLKEIVCGPSAAAPLHAIEAQMLRHGRTDADFGYSTAVHAIDMMRFLGGDVTRVEVRKLDLAGNERPSYFIDFLYRSGAHGRLSVLPEAGLAVERYTVHAHGATTMLEAPLDWTVDYPGRILHYNGRDRHFVQDNRNFPPGDSAEVTGFLGESAHFIDCLLRGAKPSPSLAECLQSIQIAETVLAGRSMDF